MSSTRPDRIRFPSPIGEVVSYIIATGREFEANRFPSPIGEVVSYIEWKATSLFRAIHGMFPSPVGEVVSYMASQSAAGFMSAADVSVPYRGSSFLYP